MLECIEPHFQENRKIDAKKMHETTRRKRKENIKKKTFIKSALLYIILHTTKHYVLYLYYILFKHLLNKYYIIMYLC